MLSFRRSPVTTLLFVAIVAVFVLQLVVGDRLIVLGANDGRLVRQGEVWRLVTSMFLHGSFVHLAMNAWALLQLGGLFEMLLGSRRLLLVYFASGIAGSCASAFFTHSLSVGASGAIFGLMGALIAFLLRHRDILTPGAKSLLGQLVLWAGVNIALGASMPKIDNAAHLGGCAAGMLLGFALQPRRPEPAPLPPPAY